MTDTIESSEIDLLKERATEMGIPFSPNIGIDKLRERVNEKLAPKPQAEAFGTLTKAQRYRAVRAEATKLIRVNIICLNPSKKEYNGEWVRVGNSAVPTITRFVPYEEETHVEQMVLDHLKTRQYAVVTHIKGPEGRQQPQKVRRKEFQIEILPPLTHEELEALAIEQSKRGSV